MVCAPSSNHEVLDDAEEAEHYEEPAESLENWVQRDCCGYLTCDAHNGALAGKDGAATTEVVKRLDFRHLWLSPLLIGVMEHMACSSTDCVRSCSKSNVARCKFCNRRVFQKPRTYSRVYICSYICIHIDKFGPRFPHTSNTHPSSSSLRGPLASGGSTDV